MSGRSGAVQQLYSTDGAPIDGPVALRLALGRLQRLSGADGYITGGGGRLTARAADGHPCAYSLAVEAGADSA